MAHNIQKRDIQVGTDMAWHGLTTIEEKIERDNSRICYPMAIADTYFRDNEGVERKGNGRQIFSLDDNLPIGRCVGADYKLISNGEIWDSVEKGLAGTNHSIVSTGTVNDRSLGFISVKLSENFMAANREHNPQMNILWGHGGNHAVVAKTGFTTIVCENTFSAAMREKGDFKLSIRHTANANILDLSQAIDAHIGVIAEFKAAMDEFHTVDVSNATAQKVYAGFIAGNSVPDTKTGISRTTNIVNRLTELFASGKGNSGRTKADLFNGVTDFYSHESAGENRPWKQFVSSEFGSAGAAKQEFFDILKNSDRMNEVGRNGEKVLAALGI